MSQPPIKNAKDDDDGKLSDHLRHPVSLHDADKPNEVRSSPTTPLSTGHSGAGAGISTLPSSSSSSSAASGPTTTTETATRRSSSSSAGVSSSKTGPMIFGNICPSGNFKSVLLEDRKEDTTLHSGTGYMGYGNITCSSSFGGVELDRARQAEKAQRDGNGHYAKGDFLEALRLYDRACALSRTNAAYQCNRAKALGGLGRVGDAVRACEEALQMDARYAKAHELLARLFIRLGDVEYARKHLRLQIQADASELKQLNLLENHLKKCANSRRAGDWDSVLKGVDAAIAAGADCSRHLWMCRAEALLNLHQIESAESVVANRLNVDSYTNSSLFFGMRSEEYTLFVLSKLDMASGRFDSALSNAKKAGESNSQNSEISSLVEIVQKVIEAHKSGNNLYNDGRYDDAGTAYTKALSYDPKNPVLYCKKAVCMYNAEKWQECIEQCNHALRFSPKCMEAIKLRAESNSKLERWAEAIDDYVVLRRETPDDKKINESLFLATLALKKCRGEEILNVNFEGEVEGISSPQELKNVMGLPGVSVVYFKVASDYQCLQLAPLVDTLCARYPATNFFSVDIAKTPQVAEIVNVKNVPTFLMYKNAKRLKIMVRPSPDMLEISVRHYSEEYSS